MWSFALAFLMAAYPVSERIDQVDDYHGVKVADPYRWLEDLDSPKTQAWVEAQRAFTRAWFAGVPGREAAIERMRRLWNFDRTPPDIIVRGDRVFFLKQTGLENQPVLYVRQGGGEPRVVLDANRLSADGTVSVPIWEPSPDGKLLVYGLAQAGSDWRTLRVREVDTGRDLADRLEWVKFTQPAWAAGGEGFYYARFPQPAGNALTAANQHHKLYFHRLGASQVEDRLIYEWPDHPDWLFNAKVTDDGRYLVITVEKGTLTHTLLFYQDLKAGDGRTHELIPEFYAAQTFLGNRGATFYVLTTDGAPRGRVVAIDLERPARDQWREVVPQSEHRLEHAVLDGDRLALQYLKDATGLVRELSLDGRVDRRIPLPEFSTITPAVNSARFFTVASFTAPQSIFECDGSACRPWLQLRQPFDASGFQVRQVFYTSKDGTRIPMFLVHRAGIPRDGSNPTLLYGYGGFDISVTPDFTPRFLGFLEMGGVLAVANLRGGGEYGEQWHNAGRLHNKQNVFDDFIAAAEWLIAERYTSPARLAIEGRSNGGLLIGAVLNQRPDLFGAAVPWVGVMDMLRFHKFTIGAAWVSDYGSPDNPEDFRVLYRYSPLHNIRPGVSYPPTLILTADHDDRVVPAHSYKYAAALQNAQKGAAPILIRIGSSAGHGAGKPTSMRIEEDADVLTFLAQALGMNPGEKKAEAKTGEWKPLFDGKTLDGWRETPFPARGKVSVENGVIVLHQGYMTGITYTRPFPNMNYEIRMEAARLEGSDFFASLTFPVGDSFCTWVVGGWGGSLVGLSSLDGMDASENDTTTFWQFEKGRYYRLRLRVVPGRISAWIDDDPAVDADVQGRYIGLRPGDIELSKPLGVASWSTTGAIRKIEYRLIDPSESTAAPQP